ncbi:cysteine-rich receptor-like protein kinase 2 isoform X2 [Malania oleifera]|uniref:cysteine-rich receptor-like protein kinase 2 isoform X2 n=1 Tax=Malania oleifera TaxID=397392 RepID=UPI0025AE0ECA|nr:cysteine-rich receptor-like protein kinase 2 isoform X2 [Malania oleifera]
MGFSGHFLGFALVILVMKSCLRTPMADPRTSVAGLACNSSVSVSADVLANNFVPAMYNLSSLINQSGFGTTRVGEDPNAVYGLAQCYGDLNPTDCRLCFSEIRSILPKCYPKTGGRIFFDGCFGRYENFSFFSEGLDSVELKNCSSNTSSQPVAFREALTKVVGSVSLEALRRKGFAVGTESVSNLSIYALAQCWENLDKQTCNSCLQAAVSSIVSCSPSVDGRSLHAGCYLRYSNKPFWNTYGKNSSGKRKLIWSIVGSVLAGFLLLTGIGIWTMKRHSRSSKSRSFKDSMGSELSAAIIHSKLNFKYQELKRATDNFDSSKKLGQGSYGTVYKGVLPDGREVAVKRLFINTKQWADQFFNEVNLLNQLHHKNLVKLLGCSLDGPESLLVYEYYFNKSLDNFIFDLDQAKLLDWQMRVDIIQGVAEGLSYLHEDSEIRIIHRDIKASNVLLDDKLKPKITDFGLARSFAAEQTHLSTGVAGTLGYMAPEYVVHGHLTEKADVYSFGVLLLEIVTGQRCNTGTGGKPGEFLLAKIWSKYKANMVNTMIDRSIYETAIEEEYLHIVHVGLLCTQATPGYRPTMTKVVELLRRNKEHEDVIPTEPPFLDILGGEIQEAESSYLLSSTSGPSFSASSGFRKEVHAQGNSYLQLLNTPPDPNGMSTLNLQVRDCKFEQVG